MVKQTGRLFFFRDLIHAARSLSNARAFTFVCVVTLGIGMSPIIAIQYGSRMFTTPPPGLDTTDLVEIFTTEVGRHQPTGRWSYADFVELRNAETGISLTGWAPGGSAVTLPESGMKAELETLYVGADYFRTIGVTLARGRGFTETAVPEPEIVFGHAFWQTRLSSDPDIVGKRFTVNGAPHVAAGVAPAGFGGHLALQDAEVFLPLERHPELFVNRNARFDRGKAIVRLHGRLSPGVSVSQASAAVSALTAQLAKEYPATNEFRAGIAVPYHPIGNHEAEETAILVAFMQAMTALPLIVVCLNVAGMMQVRGAMRERELTIRQAIGATRRRLIQHLLAEAVLLATAGGALASFALFNIPPLLSWWMGEPIPAQMQTALKVDVSMIAICLGICLATSLVFGLLPALRFSRPKIMTVLKDEAGTGGVRAGRVHRVAAALQVAISVPLLILSFRSLEQARATATADMGFALDSLYAAPVDPALPIQTARENLSRTSGVAAVTLADGIPLDFRYRMARVSTQVDPKFVSAHVTRVGDGYLDAMGIQLMRGRAFGSDDSAAAPLVTIVSKVLADELFPGDEIIGKTIAFDMGGDGGKGIRTMTIVGVTADFPTSQVATERQQLLLPLAQHPDVERDSVRVDDDRSGRKMFMLVARGVPGESSAKLTSALENAVRDIDPDFDRSAIVTGTELRQKSMNDFMNGFAVGGVAGGITLLLSALGLYGVVGLMVTTRTRELAVRVTIGASRAKIVGMIVTDVLKLVGPGVAAGVLIMIALVRLDGGIRISAVEPLAYVAGAAIALLTAVLASLAPARRAASVQPMVAMRST